jgi:hypothetical protein
VSQEAERELEAIRAKMARGELDPGRMAQWREVSRTAKSREMIGPDLPPGFDLGEVVE